jgi:hypothetical protein
MTGGSWQLQTALTLSGESLKLNAPAAVSQALAPVTRQTLSHGTGTTTGSGKFGVAVAKSYGIAPGGTVTVNLYDGTLTDLFNDAANFRLLQSYAIWISSGGDEDGVTVGNADTNGHPLFFGSASHTKTVYPSSPADGGGSDAGVAVTSSACNVKLVNNGAVTAVVGVYFAGSSAVGGVPIGMLLGLTYP